jgi:hypothetical protein
MEKKCKKCNVVKDVSEFNKAIANKDGVRNECKVCMKLYKKKHYKANKESIDKKNKEWYKANENKVKKYREYNKEKKAQYNKKYNKVNRGKRIEYMNKYNHTPKVKEKREKRYEANKEEINNNVVKYIKSRIKTDSLFRLKWSTRANIHRYLRDGKSKRTREIIGIGFKEFQDYLEVEYTEGMHLDHIIPLSWANNDEEVYTLNHYSNFQIITAEENLAKSDRYCKSENLKKVLDNHNDLTKLNEIIERNSDKIK